jgi:predicted Fe-Mo cluster-binding NifX family protein
MENSMNDLRIAFITDDGLSVSAHFGKAPSYRVFSVTDGQVADLGARPKPYHGADNQPATTHGDMFAPISDCQVLVAGGMGTPAWQSARQAGLEVILAGGEIEAALKAFVRGELTSDERRVHDHRH